MTARGSKEIVEWETAQQLQLLAELPEPLLADLRPLYEKLFYERNARMAEKAGAGPEENPLLREGSGAKGKRVGAWATSLGLPEDNRRG